jgi:hypothetical protein
LPTCRSHARPNERCCHGRHRHCHCCRRVVQQMATHTRMHAGTCHRKIPMNLTKNMAWLMSKS